MPSPKHDASESSIGQEMGSGSSAKAIRVGAVNYLNSKPLIYNFEQLAKGEQLSCDLPSRLADALHAAKLDVALIPTYEALRDPSYQIVSDACVAAEGPVLSVKVYFRVPPEKVTSLTLDEGSRTSATLAQVLLWQRFGIRPKLTKLPIGAGLAEATGDAILLIGDRAMREPNEPFVASWDLSEEWHHDTGLPFVFACWTARSNIAAEAIAPLLTACRDAGCQNFEAIAQQEASNLGLTTTEISNYLQHNLQYQLGARERAGLEEFRSACQAAGFLPPKETTGGA